MHLRLLILIWFVEEREIERCWRTRMRDNLFCCLISVSYDNFSSQDYFFELLSCLKNNQYVIAMIEAFDVAAEVIVVVQITKSILVLCNDYKNSLRDASWELFRIRKEMNELLHVLESLKQLARNAESFNSAQLLILILLCDRDDLLKACLNEIKRLKKKLKFDWTKKSDHKMKAFVQSLRTFFKEDDTIIALEIISRFKVTLHLTLIANHTYASVLA